ncbi:MAG: anthranilate phosphoribosyltransferase [Sphaerochaetaceae bacterium]|nr:anthranilate phosphoribosyltransferase [Sphaerochaetaceae bacterium]MDC7243914.1 anthranilate phosphoribosyltransferase [Sphaerochaetaceae bacterium]
MIKEAIIKLSQKEDLDALTAETVMDEIMSGKASNLQIGAYLIALSMKGETIDEITASAKIMRQHALKLLNDLEVLEIVGTGGDHSNSFNISTTSSIVVSACGIPVAKHGNRAASSKCGAADVLEELGVNINIEVEKAKDVLDKIGICFLFAQKYHSAMRFVAPVRKELSIRTIFNILGPLSNPAGASYQLMGVYDESLVEPLAQVLLNLGVKRGLVVYGLEGLDEISLVGKTKVCEIRDGWVKNYEIDPRDYGFSLCKKEDLVGGTPKENAQIIKDIFSGKKGPKRDTVVLNSAAALYIGKDNITFEDAIKEVKDVIDSGKALNKLNQMIKYTNEV